MLSVQRSGIECLECSCARIFIDFLGGVAGGVAHSVIMDQQKEPIWIQWSTVNPRWSQAEPSGAEWSQDGAKWSQVEQSGFEVEPSGFEAEPSGAEWI